MIHDIEENGFHGEGHRTLAVVAEREERAGEVRAQFAALGEEVETRWYANPQALLARADAEGDAYSAVILFSGCDERATEADEVVLRGRLAHTPLFLVAA